MQHNTSFDKLSGVQLLAFLNLGSRQKRMLALTSKLVNRRQRGSQNCYRHNRNKENRPLIFQSYSLQHCNYSD